MSECGGKHVQQTPAQALASQKAVPTFASLPSKYNLPAHPIYQRATSSTSTLEGEYSKYKNGPLSPPETDLIEFWSVSHAVSSIIL